MLITSDAECGCRPSTFQVIVGDAVKRRDPTQTADVRKRFRVDIANRLRILKRLLRVALIDQDIMGFSRPTVASISVIASRNLAQATGATKLDAFQDWLWTAITEVFVGRPGMLTWTAHYIRTAYDRGWLRAQTLAGHLLQPNHDRLDALVNLTYSELEGIADAMYQQANREMTNVMMKDGPKPTALYSAIAGRLDAIGATRGRAMAATMVVRAHAEATLDAFAAAGITHVGTVAERFPKTQATDARKTGPGSKVPRSKVPSRRTVGRIRRVQKKLEGALGEEVDVLTAGDDKVCPICEDIAASGPYSIDTARGLIPAHPDCRCAFVPALGLSIVPDAGPWDPNKHPRDPHGKFAALDISAMREYTPKELDWEYEREYKVYMKGRFPNAFSSREDFQKKYDAAPLRHLTIDELKSLGNSMAASGMGKDEAWVHKTFGHRRDTKRILEALKNGQTAPPIVLKSGHKLTLMAGQTRLAAGLAIGKIVPVKVIDVTNKSATADVLGGLFDWDPVKHPRQPAGSEHGGEFAPEGAALSSADLTALEPDWGKFTDVKARKRAQAAIAEYTGSNYDDINKALRTGDGMDWAYGPQQTYIRGLDRTFDTAGHDLKQDTLVYRGIGGSRGDHYPIGTVFEDRAFVSTSNDKAWAEPFTGRNPLDPKASGGFLMHITVPKGTRVISPNAPLMMGKEDIGAANEPELLLKRGTRFRVIGRRGNDLHVRVVS